jgi:cardiolipin synthase
MSEPSPYRYPEYYLYNKVELVRGGADYFDLLEQLIDRATHSVYLQVYILDADETGWRIARALFRAVNRNVYVHVLADGYASQFLPEAYLKALKNGGVHFRYFEPLFRSRSFYFGRRLHHKVTVVDGRWALVGGLNISNRYNDTPESSAWLDWAALVEGEVAQGLYNICASRALSDWRIHPDKIPPSPTFELPDTVVRIGIRVNDWARRKHEITRCYLRMIGRAKNEVLIMSSYFFPGHRIRRQLIKAANRGVRIRVVVAGYSDVQLAKHAERYMYRWMLNHQIEIYEYQRNVLHAKVAICDKAVVTLGSYNLNEISERASVELNLEIDDSAFARHAHRKLEEIISRDCTRITSLDTYSWWSRLLQQMAYRLIRFLLLIFTFYFRQRE